ncbi:hypothetical protein EV177_008528, partial [Coemansia sp. RSA 1804]
MLVKSYICVGLAAAATAAAAAKSDDGGKHGVRMLGGSSKASRAKKHRAVRASSSSLAFDPNSVSMDEKITVCNDNSNFCNNV